MDGSILIAIRVTPRSSHNALTWVQQGVINARLKAPPVNGAANTALINLLAETLQVPRRNIQIVRGTHSRQKTVEVSGLSIEEVEHRLTVRET